MSAGAIPPSAYNLLQLYRQHRDEIDAITDPTCLFILAFTHRQNGVRLAELAGDLGLAPTALRAKIAPLVRGQLAIESKNSLAVTPLGKRVLEELGFFAPPMPSDLPEREGPPRKPPQPPTTTGIPGWLWGMIAFLGTAVVALIGAVIVGALVLPGVFNPAEPTITPEIATSVPPSTPVTPSATPTFTLTPTSTPTFTLTHTPTSTPTSTPSPTPSPTSTRTRTPTPSIITSPNLIVNGDAEFPGQDTATNDTQFAKPQFWLPPAQISFVTVVQYGAQGGFADNNSPGPPNRGKNFFVGGPNNESSSVYQKIDPSKWRPEVFSWIDAGRVSFELDGWLGGYEDQEDYAIVTTYFYNDGARVLLQKSALGPVKAKDRLPPNKTGLVFRSIKGAVPKGARLMDISMEFVRVGAGSYNDASVDNLSLILTVP